MLVAERGEALAEHLGVGRAAARLLARLAGDRVVRRQAVPLLLVRLGEAGIPSLLGDDVHEPRAGHARARLNVSQSFSMSCPSIGPK